jgi:hypothetical protein
MTSWRGTSHPLGSTAYFFTVKNQQLKNVLCWLGVVLCRRENDEYRCTCVGCGLPARRNFSVGGVCVMAVGSGRPVWWGLLAVPSGRIFFSQQRFRSIKCHTTYIRIRVIPFFV